MTDPDITPPEGIPYPHQERAVVRPGHTAPAHDHGGLMQIGDSGIALKMARELRHVARDYRVCPEWPNLRHVLGERLRLLRCANPAVAEALEIVELILGHPEGWCTR